MPKKTSTQINVNFVLDIPKTSVKKAKKLIEEMIGTIMKAMDDQDCPMDSFYGFFKKDNDLCDYGGYLYGFDAVAKINGKKVKIKID